jgi:hypothetical protein
LVNLTNAKAQGLGNDIPTQNQLIASAIGQIDRTGQAVVYTQSNLTIVTDTPASQKSYGDALATEVTRHPGSNFFNTMVAIDNATSQNNPDQLKGLESIASDYRVYATELLKIPVPQTFAPFHLELINNFQKISETYPSMEVILEDPLKGLSAVKDYQSLTQETLQVFINIAQALGKNGILFTKDEPGSAWGTLLSAQ